MKPALLLAALALAAPATLLAQSVRVVHAPEQATDAGAPSSGIIIYVDPETGRTQATPPPGMRVQAFPEFQSDPSRIREEQRADGSVITWLNGEGMEAQVLTFDVQGQPVVACTSVLESGPEGRHVDLRFARPAGRLAR